MLGFWPCRSVESVEEGGFNHEIHGIHGMLGMGIDGSLKSDV